MGYCDITTQQREAFQWGRIGCTVLNPYWGRGYGTECARALVSLASGNWASTGWRPT